MGYPSTGIAPVAHRTPQLIVQMELLEKVTESLTAGTQELCGRLVGVCRLTPPLKTSEAAIADESLVPLAERMRLCVFRCNLVADTLRDCLERLEL